MTPYTYFVIFAEMRTGSNLLEASLNAIDGVSSFGELFNPHFVGGPKNDKVFGVSLADREAEPTRILSEMRRSTKDLPGFRFFCDHDVRILRDVIADPDCAKIILTRNPLDTYVSRKIAGETGQWRLGDLKDRREAVVDFDSDEFGGYLEERQEFQADIRRMLQEAGQTAFQLTYDDIQSVQAVNGLVKFLGVEGRLDRMPAQIKKQNPMGILEKVKNPEEMRAAVAGFEWLDLEKAPDFEPRRGPRVPDFITAAHSPILFLPIPGSPDYGLRSWLRNLDGAEPIAGYTQKTLRNWLKARAERRVISVLSHPVERAYEVFSRRFVSDGPEKMGALCDVFSKRYGLNIPAFDDPPADISKAFEGFLGFLEGNLAGQTSVRVDPIWKTQSSTLEAFGKVVAIDQLIRADDLKGALPDLAQAMGLPTKATPDVDLNQTVPLSAIYSDAIERAARRTYRRDYLFLGFKDWGSGRL